ncbi:MAG: hypothetical protein ACJ782_14140 [Actinomycetota bacterium]|jgi:hypothetical protein
MTTSSMEHGVELVVAVDLGQQALEGAAGGGVDHRRHPPQRVQEVLADVAVVGGAPSLAL